MLTKLKENKMKTTPAQFVRQVKQEVAKITWPTRSETMQGTMTVIVMSVILACFLFLIDLIFAYAIRVIVG
jgi:preprotein translocase subunit SecE